MTIKKIFYKIFPYKCILCGIEESDIKMDLCNPCLNNLPFAKNYTCFKYTSPIDRLILQIKFGEDLVAASILGKIFAARLQDIYCTKTHLPEMIIPIPLHKKRLRERGFNQATELAKPIAKLLKIPLARNVCKRIKHTKPQAELSSKERIKNVKNAFQTKYAFDNKYIAVIDDVITTGNTMHSFCQMLKANGAKNIDIWCIARPEIISGTSSPPSV